MSLQPARIVFPDCSPYMAAHLDEGLRCLVPELAVDVAAPAPDALVARARDSVALIHFQTRLSAAMLAECRALRLIVFLGTGVSSWVDLPAAEAQGITVRRVLNYGDRAVAEHALALIMASARKLALMDRRLRAGTWRLEAGLELAGSTLGIVGLGGIGRTLAAIGAALGCTVIGWNRSPIPPEVPCRMVPLDEVLATADIVSLHLGLNEETRGIIDARRIGLLRPGAILVNTARGGLLDEAALLRRLAAGEIAAGLDVYAQEPLGPGHAFAELETVTLSPHAGWMTPQAARRLWQAGLTILRDELTTLGL